MVNQHPNFGLWEIRRSDLLFALLNEFTTLLLDNEKCLVMDKELALA